MSAWARVAKITKARNLEGSVVARSVDGLPFLLFEGLQVHFVPPTLKGPRSATVASVQSVKDDAYEVAFEGVDSVDDAEAITGCVCLAAKSDLPTGMVDLPLDWMDYTVVDERFGNLGTVAEVQASAAQSLIVVEGPHGSVMIPAVDEFIDDVDDDAATISVHIPDGLIGLQDPERDAGGEAR